MKEIVFLCCKCFLSYECLVIIVYTWPKILMNILIFIVKHIQYIIRQANIHFRPMFIINMFVFTLDPRTIPQRMSRVTIYPVRICNLMGPQMPFRMYKLLLLFFTMILRDIAIICIQLGL